MKFLTENVLLIGLAIGSGFMLIWPLFSRGSGSGQQATPAQAVQLINRSHALVLDVRDDAEFASGHIGDARHIPLKQLPERLKELTRYKDKTIVVNCQGGVRSAKACDILRKEGFTKVHNLQGGLNAWTQAKLPLIKN